MVLSEVNRAKTPIFLDRPKLSHSSHSVAILEASSRSSLGTPPTINRGGRGELKKIDTCFAPKFSFLTKNLFVFVDL